MKSPLIVKFSRMPASFMIKTNSPLCSLGTALFCCASLTGAAQAAAGDLDTSFGNGGKVVTSIGTSEEQAFAISLQQNGRILVGGFSNSATDLTKDFALVRYTTSGGLDSSFGSNGKVTTSLGSGNDQINALAVQGDGKILAAGFSSNGAINRFAVVRYNSGGALDSSFGSGGQVITAFASGTAQANAMLFQPDGKILLGGTSFVSASSGGNDFALARYNADGSLDGTFGNRGLMTTDFAGADDTIAALALQPDGKIVAAGTSGANAAARFAVARYNADGSLDGSFGSGGMATVGYSGGAASCTCMALQGNGRILLGGYAQPSPVSFALARFTADGVLDSSFGNGGFKTTTLSSTNAQAYAMTFQKGAKIVLAGTAFVGSGYQFALARYDNLGNLDNSFGGGDGVVYTSFGTFNDSARALAVQSDGKLVATGFSNNGGSDFATARYSSGSVDLTPQITGINPTAAPIGDPLTISGYNFTGATQVLLGSTLKPQPFTVIDSSHIRVSAIAPGTDSGKIRVVTPQGTAVSTDRYRLLPKITGFSPASGPAGTLVTVTGTGFRLSNGSNVSAVRFSFPGGRFITGTNLNVISKVKMTVRVPAGAISGPIRARSTYGASQSEDDFTVTAGALKAGPSGQIF